MVRDLLQQLGIEGFGGATGGVEALRVAAIHQHVVDIMTTSTKAGVVDNGRAVIIAVAYGRELIIKVLLRQREGDVKLHISVTGTTRRHALAICSQRWPLVFSFSQDGECCEAR